MYTQGYFLIQYIHIEDLAAPRASALSPVLEANANAHDCYGTITRYRRQSFSDCSDHTDAMHYDYPDPAQNGKIVRVEGEILDPIRLPVGVHQVIFTSVDACGHFTEKAVPAIITDITPPTPVCDSHLVTTVDPQTCWSRIYATDLDQGSRDNCQSTLHFAAASMDSIVYWQNYWYGYLEQKCGKTAYWAHINTYQNLIDHWINCYVFGDYVELASCVDKQVVLRAYEADYIPLYDPHGTILTNHEWYCLHATSFGRTELNYSYFKSGFKSVTRPKLDCIDTLRLRYYDAPVFDPEESYLPTQRKKAYCTLSLLDSSRLLTNGCNGIRYNDCMTTVTVVDKTPPVASTPDDIEVFCDGAQYGRAEDICSSSPDKEKISATLIAWISRANLISKSNAKRKTIWTCKMQWMPMDWHLGTTAAIMEVSRLMIKIITVAAIQAPGVLSTAIGGYVKTNMINRFLKSPICFQSLTMELLTTNLMGI